MIIDYNYDLGVTKKGKTNEAGQVISDLVEFPNGEYKITSTFEGDEGYESVSVDDWDFLVINGYYTRFYLTVYDKNNEKINRYCNTYIIENGTVIEKNIINVDTGEIINGELVLNGKYYDGHKIGIKLEYSEEGLFESTDWKSKTINDVILRINNLEYNLNDFTDDEFIYNIYEKPVKLYKFKLEFNETYNMEECKIEFTYDQNKNNINFYDHNNDMIIDEQVNVSFIDEFKEEKITVKTEDGLTVPNLLYYFDKPLFDESINYTNQNGEILIDNIIRSENYKDWNDSSFNIFDNNLIVCKDNCELIYMINHNIDYTLKIGSKLNIEISSEKQKWKFLIDDKYIEYECKNILNSNYILTISKFNNVFRIMIDNNYICGFDSSLFGNEDYITFSDERLNINEKYKVLLTDSEETHISNCTLGIRDDINIVNKNINIKTVLKELLPKEETFIYEVDGYYMDKVMNDFSKIDIVSHNIKQDYKGYVFNKNTFVTNNNISVNELNINNNVNVLLFKRNSHSVLDYYLLDRNVCTVNWKLMDYNETLKLSDFNIEMSLDKEYLHLKSQEENEQEYELNLTGNVGIRNINVYCIVNGIDEIYLGESSEDGSIEYQDTIILSQNVLTTNTYQLLIKSTDLENFNFNDDYYSEVKKFTIKKYVEETDSPSQTIPINPITVTDHIINFTEKYIGNGDIASTYYIEVIDVFNLGIKVYLNGREYYLSEATNFDDENGYYIYRFEIGQLPAGTHNLSVITDTTIINTNTIESQTKTKTFTVNKISTELKITSVKKGNTVLSYSNTEKDYHITSNVYKGDEISFVCATNIPVGSIIKIDEVSYTVPNTQILNFNITVNNNSFSIVIENSSTSTNNIYNVYFDKIINYNTKMTLDGSDGYWGTNVTLTAKLVDENNKILSGKNVIFTGDNIISGNSLVTSKTVSTNSSGLASVQVKLPNTVNTTKKYTCTFNTTDRYNKSTVSKSIKSKIRPVSISTVHNVGSSSSKPVYKSWDLIYTVKDTVNGATISNPTVAIYVDGKKQSTSYSSGKIKASMPDLGSSTGKTVQCYCSFKHDKYESKSSSKQNVYYISGKTLKSIPNSFMNDGDGTVGHRGMWHYGGVQKSSDGDYSSSGMSKANLTYGSGDGSYLICSNKDYPIKTSSSCKSLKLTNWTNLNNLPSSVKTFSTHFYLRESCPTYTYDSKKWGAEMSSPSVKFTFNNGETKTLTGSKVDNGFEYCINGKGLGVEWKDWYKGINNALLSHGKNTSSKAGLIFLSQLCVVIDYIPKQTY